MVTYPNPAGLDVWAGAHDAGHRAGDEIGDIWEAARVAGVQPGTIRVWMSRGKIEPIIRGERGEADLFHLPTIARAAAAGVKHRPADPAANRRGHRRTTAA